MLFRWAFLLGRSLPDSWIDISSGENLVLVVLGSYGPRDNYIAMCFLWDSHMNSERYEIPSDGL